jgi:hypothetical protein
MSRRGIPEVRSESAGGFAEDIVAVFRADRTPIETWLDREWFSQDEEDESLHPVSLLRECLDNHSLVLLSPSLHHSLHGLRVYHRFDVIDNVLLLSAFVMKRHTVSECQWSKSGPNIELGAAGDADVEMW